MPYFDILYSVILAVVLLNIWTLYVAIDDDFCTFGFHTLYVFVFRGVYT